MSYAQFILLCRVGDAIPGLWLIQNKAKQNRAPSQHDHWLSPVLGLGKWPAQPSGCGKAEERTGTRGCSWSSTLRVGRAARLHVCLGGHQTLGESTEIRWSFSVRSKRITSFSSPLPKGPGCRQVCDAVASFSCHHAGLGFMSLAIWMKAPFVVQPWILSWMAAHGPLVHPSISCFSQHKCATPVSLGGAHLCCFCFPVFVPLIRNAFPSSLHFSVLEPTVQRGRLGLRDGQLRDMKEAGGSQDTLQKVTFELGGDGRVGVFQIAESPWRLE